MSKEMKIFLVGGAVRDKLLGKESDDLDYVVLNGTPEKMLALGFTEAGKDFPVFLHPETKDEHALARMERSTGKGYNDFESSWEGVTLEDDLMRRDLTINAMAEDETGQIVDIFGGKKDLENKVLRHVSEAFKEDPLRILRVARFASKMKDFTVAPETMSMMQEMVKDGMIDHLTPERVWKEWWRAMVTPEPHRFFEVLKDTGALKVLFPVLDNMKDVPQRADYHAEGDVFVHTMMVLKEATELTKDMDEDRRLLVRMGALLHDVGKTKTPHELLYNEDGSMKGSHTGHDDPKVARPLIQELKEQYKLSDFIARFCLDVAAFHQRIHSVKKMKKTSGWAKLFNDMKIRQHADELGEDHYLENILLACKADARGRLMTVDNKIVPASREYEQADIMKDKFKEYKKALVVVGEFFTVAKDYKLNIEPKTFPTLRSEVIVMAMENKSFFDILSDRLSKENRNMLRSKGFDFPVSNKELKKQKKQEEIRLRKEARRKNRL